ncbi:MAG: tetratricopeptide repeat protein [Arenicellales bacterium]|nr:tetratricopeptide repeat protein [Arenicellales bacterium]
MAVQECAALDRSTFFGNNAGGEAQGNQMGLITSLKLSAGGYSAHLARFRHAAKLQAICGLVILALVSSPNTIAAEDVQTLLESGKYAEAAAAARASLDQGIDTDHNGYLLGEALLSMGQLPEALAAFEQALSDDSDHRFQIEVAISRIFLLQGQTNDASQRLQQVLVALESDTESLSSTELTALADAARLLGYDDPARYRLALRLYEQAIVRDDDNLAARVALADLLLDKYNNTEASALYKEVLAIDPRYALALFGLARSQYFDHSRAAIQLVRQALEVQPSLVPARVLLARMLLEMEDYSAAEEELEQALTVNPNSPEALTMQLVVRYLQSDPEGFKTLLTRLRELVPGYIEVYATLAEIAAQNRLYSDAVSFAREALVSRRSFSRAHGLLGLNLLRLGQIDSGRRSLEQAFRGDPFNVWTKNTLDLVDRLDELSTLRQGRFILVAATHEAELLAPLLFPLAEAAYTHFAERYGHEPRTPIRIEVYPSHEDFSVRTVGLVGVDILGVSFGPTVAFDSPSVGTFGSINWGSVLWHELAHTFHLSMSGSRVPRWFTEGLAVVEEHRARPGWGGDVDPGFLEAYLQQRLPPASRLNEAFTRPSYPRQVVHAYFLSSLLLAFVEERYGIDAIRSMLNGYREGLTTESNVSANLGLTMSELDQQFDTYVRIRFAHALEALDISLPANAPSTAGPAMETTKSFRSLWRAGGNALRAGELERAEKLLSEAKRQFPEFAGAGSPYHLLAQLHLKRGNAAAASTELESVVNINADDLSTHRKLAELYLAENKRDDAAQILERVLFIDPFEIGIREQLASIYEAQGQWESAVPERAAAAMLAPLDPAGARFRLANALAQNNEFSAARRELLRALEDAPMYDDALQLLLDIRQTLNQNEHRARAVPTE